MKLNKLINIFMLTALMGFCSQGFASLVSMDAEGFITSYTYNTAIDPFGGSINVGDAYSTFSIFDNATAIDSNPNDSIGRYAWEGDIFQSNISIGENSFNTQDTTIAILNDWNGVDSYQIRSWGATQNEMLFFSIFLTDVNSSVFNSDEFVLEPDLALFTHAVFILKSFDIATGELNYKINGNVVSLVDPPRASVPAPNAMLLLGLGLIGIFFAGKGYRKED